MQINELIISYLTSGISIIPVEKSKKPFGAWTSFQKKIISPELLAEKLKHEKVFGIGAVCGSVSGNLECLDFDLKYHKEPKKIMTLVFKELKSVLGDEIFKKLFVQKTRSGGYHIVYRCESKVEGNQKLAFNNQENPEAFIETRGEGGQFLVYPTEGYEKTQGSLTDLPILTGVQRDNIIAFTKSLCEKEKAPVETKGIPIKDIEKNKESLLKKAPENIWEAYNQSYQILKDLETVGWKVTKEEADRVYVLRPDSESEHSGYMYKDTHFFYLWTNNAYPLQPQKCYNPSTILGQYIFKGNWHEAANYLKGIGFKDPSEQRVSEGEFNKKKDAFDYLIPSTKLYEELLEIKEGRVQLGLSTGIPTLNEFFLLKKPNFVMFLGRDNTGKSAFSWYLSLLASMIHGWKTLIFCFENKPKHVARKLIEFYWSLPIDKISDEQFNIAFKFIDSHFKLVGIQGIDHFKKLYSISSDINAISSFDIVIIDPLNALDRLGKPIHDYIQEFVNYTNKWRSENDCCVFLNLHAVTAANRASDDKGKPIAPSKYDAEGGGKLASGADDFLVIHRDAQDELNYNVTEIHVQKIKETETGGRQTFRGKPVKLRALRGVVGFTTIDDDVVLNNGINPIIEIHKMNGQPITLEIEEAKEYVRIDSNVSGLLAIKQEVDVKKDGMWWDEKDEHDEVPF